VCVCVRTGTRSCACAVCVRDDWAMIVAIGDWRPYPLAPVRRAERVMVARAYGVFSSVAAGMDDVGDCVFACACARG